MHLKPDEQDRIFQTSDLALHYFTVLASIIGVLIVVAIAAAAIRASLGS